ncbi:MAG: S1-like domain-containing RNA-binding protein [Campylobacterota bacterium]|nr:S1-like domain-containing RNA-binding protein [Campylobacterota bacterium]
MNEKIELGLLNRLKIERQSEPGMYLIPHDDEQEVLLPNAYITDALHVGDEIEVFVYRDSEDRVVSTTQKPLCMLGEIAILKVVDETDFGVFVDWGLPKDLFIPTKLIQKSGLKIGDKCAVHVVMDERTNRLIGTQKFGNFLSTDTSKLKTNEKVNALVISQTPLGYKVIVNNMYDGLIFKNEVFGKLEVGDLKESYIKQIRPDGKLDISLQPFGNKKGSLSSDKILEMLKSANGSLPYNYKSDAELISNVFEMSKKVFKKSLTTLSENGKIEIKDTGIYLCK